MATAAAVLMLISGIMFLCYRPPPGPTGARGAGPRGGALLEAGLDTLRLRGFSAATGKDNAGFEPHTRL